MKINLSKEEQKIILKDDSETLAARIAMYRILGSFKEEAKLAMIELMKRKTINSEEYDFEEVIKKMIEENEVKSEAPSLCDIKRNFIQNLISSIIVPKK